MRIKQAMFILFWLACAPALSAAQEPASNQPNYNPNVPTQFGSGGQRYIVPLPPHVPEYLPNGATNLIDVWTEDGGARLYWNTIIIPQELKMAGSYWIDPALVPQLLPEKNTRPRGSWRSYRRAKTKTRVKKAKAPANAASTALKAPAIPLPVTPLETETKVIPPLKAAPENGVAAQAQSARPRADTEMPDVAPPPLQ